MSDAPNGRNAVFISYSHADKRHLDQLLLHLEPLKRDRKIAVWADTTLKAGDDWREEIARALASARVAIVLVSAAFRASKFIAENELPPLLTAAKKEGVLILPVVVSACDFHDSELAGVQAVNEPSKPLEAMRTFQRDEVWVKVAQRVKEAFPTKPGQQPRKVERGDEASSASQSPNEEDRLLARGRALIAEGNYPDAIHFFAMATTRNPGSAEAWGCLAEALYIEDRYDEAVVAYDRALALEPLDAGIWNRKGLALGRLDRYEETLATSERALALEPNNGQAWANKGAALRGMGRLDEANKAEQRAMWLGRKG